MDAARERVDALKREAGAAGLPVSEGSERDFLRFLGDHPVERRPYLALLDNGNFRAVWKGPDGEQIGLQFRGGAEVQFVLFAKRNRSRDNGTILRARHAVRYRSPNRCPRPLAANAVVRGDPVPDDHHVLRYVGGAHIDLNPETREPVILGSGFISRPRDDRAISVHWLEVLAERMEDQVGAVRALSRLSHRPTARFARLNVGRLRRHIVENDPAQTSLAVNSGSA